MDTQDLPTFGRGLWLIMQSPATYYMLTLYISKDGFKNKINYGLSKPQEEFPVITDCILCIIKDFLLFFTRSHGVG